MESGEVNSSEGKEGESVQHLGENLGTTPESCWVSPLFSTMNLLADFSMSSPTHHLRYSYSTVLKINCISRLLKVSPLMNRKSVTGVSLS